MVVLAGICVAQLRALRDIQTRLAAIESHLGSEGAAPVAGSPESAPIIGHDRGAHNEIDRRLTSLESGLAKIGGADSAAHNNRATNNVEDLLKKLLDPAVPEKERLAILQALRRQKALTDEALQGTLSWLNTSQDGNVRRKIVQQLEGVTNAMMRQPMLDLALNDRDPKVREEALQGLRHFVSDPDVEKRLLAMAQTDPDPKMRAWAEDALRKGVMTPERMVRLQQAALDGNASLEDRLNAIRTLRRNGTDVSEAMLALADFGRNSTDPSARAKVYQSLDGTRDPRVVSVLVNGLQDSDSRARKEAADALSSFAGDPNVQKWLQYLAQSDPDPIVQKEAIKALKHVGL